ncbi:MAG: hypothetical protein PHE21_00525 [Candidatus Dojkabacteria bacterium]|nr:hypothetical protein [Candidatus Dojkabacteria bacterium]
MSISEDPFKEAAMQGSLDIIRDGIKSTIEGGSIDKEVMDINREDVDVYMRKIVDDQDLEYKLTRVRSLHVDDLKTFWLLCDSANVCNVEPPLIGEQKVYFLETSDSAVFLYPIQMSHKKMHIHIELFNDNTSKFIKDMRDKLNEEKDLKNIDFVKFNKVEVQKE